MRHLDALLHVRGGSVFIEDHIHRDDLLHGVVAVSPAAHGKIRKIDTSAALSMPGVQDVITASRIPGENQIGNIIMDEPLLAEEEVHFIGEPVALVLARSRKEAEAAANEVRIDIEELPGITDPREAAKAGMLIAPPRTFSMGSVEKALAECDIIVSGRADSGGQEHLYLERQGSFAEPMENGSIKVTAGTQGPTFVQKVAARVLGLPMNSIQVDVIRLGGAFGGKEDQATPWAVMAALGTHITGKPVQVVLSRGQDMAWTGKRHPYSSDFILGLNKAGKMLAWKVTYYQNGGAASDLSTAILERTLFHSTGSYFVPDVEATGICCRTNLPPNTAFRGFGAPQAMFVMEAAIRKAAAEMNLAPKIIQEKNLLRKGDSFPFGMKYGGDEVRHSWKKAVELTEVTEQEDRIAQFNSSSTLKKKGISFMPVCFGISFTNTSMNQASALVHVYVDGSVGVSTGAVEMGQGVNTKIAQVAARTLGVNLDRIKIETTNTTRAANTSPTAASSGADMNGNATRIACGHILKRLLMFAGTELGESPGRLKIKDGTVIADGSPSSLKWQELVSKAYVERISLSCQAHYATPDIHFDKTVEKGRPFAYHVAGTAVTEVTLDRLRGTFTVDRVLIVHDGGDSINPLVDRGQIQGGLVQGMGWVTMEELKYEPSSGRLLSDSLATYKVPDIMAAPEEVEIHFLECRSQNAGIYNSKAVGEPPFMYGIGTYFA
ncbi:MAG: molybdopterin-dependent oxidoreductase, partial [Candidatus Aegiribacteria sp.]|nr:molybdopterin-dependent oxidoreductase [Candidatus Aegiribacteria sp.]MBD3295608.1 molybdopterin-dependent oxidoreductase [Candidatus Fermentibacteria bacterium]